MAFLLALGSTACGGGDGDEAEVDGSGGSSEETTTTAEAPEEWDERVAPIAEWVADERELDFEHPVEVRFLPEDEYLDAATEEQEGGSGQDDEEAEEEVELLRALGLVTGEVDLEAAGDDLAGEGTLAFYSPEEEVVYVKGEELTPAVRVTVAHELTHVLQDQHFAIDRFDREEGSDDEGSEDEDASSEDDELAVGLRAVVEGDAQRIEAAYAEEELDRDEQEEYATESEEDADGGEEAVADVPPVLVAVFSAAYALGEGYVVSLGLENAAIDAALEEPPTEQELLDPAVRDTPRAEEVEVEAPEVPEGAEEVDSDTFGPLTWYLLLASRGDPIDALAVVDGWGGDAFASYREGDQTCIDVTVAGDDAEATAAFQGALDAWAAQHPGGSATVEASGDAVTLHSCDPGEGAEAAGEVAPDALAIPVTRTGLEAEVVQAQGATPEQARCLSDRLFAELTPEQLTADEVPPEIIDRVQALAQECLAG